MAKRSPKSPTEITSIRHKKDTRVNIPTEELRDFVAEDEQAPKAMRYPRDASLDPQLVWKGKDEQDASALEVPVVPIYIQEKVHPQALVENLRQTAKAGEKEPEQGDFHVHAFPSWRNGNRPRGTSATCKVQATGVTMRPEKRRFARKRRQGRRAIDTPATRQECW